VAFPAVRALCMTITRFRRATCRRMPEENAMSKGLNQKKSEKKKPEKTMKEKRADKAAKKAAKR
jgi:hypothetical protein